jgi:TolA-binding protein
MLGAVPAAAQESELAPLADIPQAITDPDAGQSQIDIANGFFHRGFFEDALQEYERYLELYPEGTHALTAWRRLGESAYAAQAYEKALAAFSMLASGEMLNASPTTTVDEPTRLQAQLRKGEVLFLLKRNEEAVATLSPLATVEVATAQSARALYYLGKSQYEMNAYPEAHAALDAVVSKFPEDTLAPYAQYQLAFVSVAQQKFQEAAVAFTAVATSKAENALRVESRYRAAEIYDKIGWFSAAVTAYKSLQEEFPDSEYARRADYGYAWALYHAGQFAEATVASELFLGRYPESPFALGMGYLRGNCLQQQQRYEEALTAYTAIRTDHPTSEFAARAHYKSAWTMYFKGDAAGAKQEAMSFLKDQRSAAGIGDAAFLLGTILMEEENYEDAYQEFRLVSEKYPDGEFGAEALYKSAESLEKLGRAVEAAETFDLFATRYPENALAATAMLRAGDVLFGSQQFSDAVVRYQRVVDSGGKAPTAEQGHYRLALALHNEKNYAASAAIFQKLLDTFPESARRAEAHFRIGEYSLRIASDAIQALAHYQGSIDLEPQGKFSGRALRGLALARFDQNDAEAAALLFARLMREYPEVPLKEETYLWVGQHFYDAEAWAAASEAFSALISHVPNYGNLEGVLFLIAECSENSGSIDQAIEDFQRVVTAAPDSVKAVEAHYRAAQLHEKSGALDTAMALYEKAANANNGDLAARARFRLAELYENSGDLDKATRSYMIVVILFLHEELSPEALWRSARCFGELGNAEKQQSSLDELLREYPESPQAGLVRDNEANGATTVSPKSDVASVAENNTTN